MDLYARLHAWRHRLFRPSEKRLTQEVFEQVADRLDRQGLDKEVGRKRLVRSIADDVVARSIGFALDPLQAERIVTDLLDYEDMFQVADVDWSQRRSITELWLLRDHLKVQKQLLDAYETTVDLLTTILIRCLNRLATALPHIDHGGEDGVTIPTRFLDMLKSPGEVVEGVTGCWFDDELIRRELFPRLRARLDANLVLASGGSPNDLHALPRSPRFPSKSNIADRRELVATYLGSTPLTQLFEGTTPFTIPTRTRFEHQHIVAGSGHGKTQTLQYLIANDLEAVANGQASIIVLDSQGDLIRTIARLKTFAPGGSLHDRVCIIDPSDVEYPVSLNLFDVGIERLQTYPMLERERLTNSILELYDFVLGSLLSAEMTQKQTVIFRYVTRLMLHIPNATIHTLRELMEQGSEVRFADDIAKLTGTARQFFESEFSSREFTDTKKQVLRRLWGILENQTFERMFSHPQSKLDLFTEMNAGKVILINTAKDLLKESGTEIFGRFFIALIAQAAQERAVLPESRRLPTFVYIDEAADYFDRNIGLILSQARKFNVGMILAHQYLGQLDAKLQDAFAANTAIKFAGGVSNKDARVLAPMLGCSTEFIEAQPKGVFAASVRGLTTSALPLAFPLGHMERLPRMDGNERAALQALMRSRHAVHYSELDRHMAPSPKPSGKIDPDKTKAKNDPDHPDVGLSPEL